MTIAVLGGYGVGITMRVPRMPRAGETVSGGVLSREHGGKGSNQAIAIARWGGSPALITAVGDDVEGRSARDLWASESVDATAVATVDAATMAGVILVDGAGENRIAIAAGALDSVWGARVEPLAAHALSDADALVISLEIPHDAALQCAALARRAGITVILNPAPAEGVPVELWQSADVLVPNQSEARALLGDDGDAEGSHVDDDLALARRLAERASGTVVVTCGEAGAVIADRAGVRRVTAPAVAVIDTTGAGDTFVGVLAAELVRGVDLDDAVDTACRAAAHSVTRHGVVDGIPRRDEIIREVA
ncbi:MAG: ribokinase [Microcella sp.]|uniref:ribokinase n=1 Tax=Microcella sp. TaxID=1913979 RepID=UPI0024CA77BA|nr:ribokinase [Microcella sp.]UYN83995.1 MAG: ribokinase [Microcella sp.]